MKKNKEPIPDFKEVEVVLKPIFGLEPKVYVPIVWGILMTLLVFFLLFFPGIVNHGSYIHFETGPEKALVYVDDKLMGTSPCEVFVPGGERRIQITKPYYETYNSNRLIKGSVFASLFFPLKSKFKVNLKLTHPQELVNYTKTEFFSWGIMKEFTRNYQFPPLLSDMAKLYENSDNQLSDEQINNLINSILCFVDSDSEAYDVLKGFSRIISRSKPLDPVSIVEFIKKMVILKQNSPLFAYWLVSFLPAQPSADLTEMKSSLFQKLVNSKWFENLNTEIKNKTKEFIKEEKAPHIKTARPINNIEFIQISPNKAVPFIMGNRKRLKSPKYQYENAFPHPVNIEAFAMAKKEITNMEFLAFIKENPTWYPSQLDYLLTKSWVDDKYLSHWQGDKPAEVDRDKPVTNISWFAAQAYCDWLESKASFQCNVSLPLEKEWEYCAYWDSKTALPFERSPVKLKAAKELKPGDLGFYGLMGNTWEWVSDNYAPQSFQLAQNPSQRDKNMVTSGLENVVKGGSYINIQDEQITSSTRGSHNPKWSTDFLSFRPVYYIK